MNAHSPASCATCANANCRLSFVSRDIAPVDERTAFVLDEMWPELRGHVARVARPDDQVLIPGAFGRTLPRYAWGRGATAGGIETVRRHMIMRKVARAAGAVRQAAYLDADRDLATAMARRIDFRAGHVVVSQTLLPFLWRDGVLGGRSFDVLMTRYPLAALHARLDAMAARHTHSPTIADFRAPETMVADEAEALAAARRVVSPHHDIAESFGDRAVWLDWQAPVTRPRRTGDRTAFLGPTVARQGAYQVREIAAGLGKPLIVFGADLEGPGFWRGVAIERRTMDADWLDDIGAILHPAAVTHAPRKLVEAHAHGVAIYADASCGLAPGRFQLVSAFAG
ncbi:hypothetical protein [Asticcacaulis solisilvae]|uniref:hypothetical protein n=1 Tax=Asticcacaulis solisilvae TaxID=1217274 RepID=UPI003FD87EF9